MGCGTSKFGASGGGETLRSEAGYLQTQRNEPAIATACKDGGREEGVDCLDSKELRRLVGSDEKEKGADMEICPLFAKESIMQKDVRRVDCMDTLEEEVFRERGPPCDNGVGKTKAGSYLKNVEREDSIMLCPGSPSFRVYCLHRDNDHGGNNIKGYEPDEAKENDPSKENEKESEVYPVKRGRKARGFGKVLQMGGSAGMRHLLSVSYRIPNLSTSQASTNLHGRIRN